MKVKLTNSFVEKAACPIGKEYEIFWDLALESFGLKVTENGAKSFVFQYRASGTTRRQRWPIGLGLDKARKEARKAIGSVAAGGDPVLERRKEEDLAKNTFKSICDEYFRREGKRLRTKAAEAAALERLVYPTLGARPIESIKRSQITRLLDKIEDERGASMAEHVLAYVRKILRWHAARDDDFRSPIVAGMGRIRPSERARKRILNDDELRAVWKAAEASTHPFGYLVRYILLTATRRSEAARMVDAELSGDDWVIPGSRYKNRLDHMVPLSKAARELLAKIPRVEGVPFIFTIGNAKAIAGFDHFKKTLDEESGVTGWTIHDLRRTSRSLLSRAGVDADHAERCLGHVIGGVRGIYDRHAYLDEKRHAFEALAAQIDRIVNPPPANVVDLRAAKVG
jgi:integrase